MFLGKTLGAASRFGVKWNGTAGDRLRRVFVFDKAVASGVPTVIDAVKVDRDPEDMTDKESSVLSTRLIWRVLSAEGVPFEPLPPLSNAFTRAMTETEASPEAALPRSLALCCCCLCCACRSICSLLRTADGETKVVSGDWPVDMTQLLVNKLDYACKLR